MKKTVVIYKILAWICLAYVLFGLCYIGMGLHYYGFDAFRVIYTQNWGTRPAVYPQWLNAMGGRNKMLLVGVIVVLCFLFRGFVKNIRKQEETLKEKKRLPYTFFDMEILIVLLVTAIEAMWFEERLLFVLILMNAFMLLAICEKWIVVYQEWTAQRCFLVVYLCHNRRKVVKPAMFMLAMVALHYIVFSWRFWGNYYDYKGFGVLGLLLVDVLIITLFVVWAIDVFNLRERVETMALGKEIQTEYEISFMTERTSEQLGLLENGIKAAVEERVKSERLKTELITNVSHDLKTPLTSVINYVQLLKREPAASEQAERYIEVLEQKTEQMRTLTEDIIELSRLMSNNVPVEKTELNFSEMVRQANGEFAEGFESRGLEVRCTLPEEDCILELDGQKTWRVLENLYTNVRKYAMGFSRVYVEVQEIANAVHFTMKNVSQAELSQAADELMERFVRGDQARTTEGSGLGLSIAKSLIEIQGGTFEIEISGDLFVAKVKLPR